MLRFCRSSKLSPLQQRSNALVDEGCQAEDVLILRRRQLMKFGTATRTGRIDSIVIDLEQETIKLVDALHSEENTETDA